MTFTFYMTVNNTDGSVVQGACSDADVTRSLATAARRGYQVEVTPQGGANIARQIPGKGRHSVVYAPFRNAGSLTATVREDLRLIATRPTAELQPETGRIKAGYINSIPPGASSLLMSRGLVAVDGAEVTVPLSTRLAMLATDHRTPPWSYEPTAGEINDLCAATSRKAEPK